MVSIIMPTYNTDHEMLGQAIDSILAQSYSNFNLIIIDDGSKNYDNYNYIIKNYSDDRITALRNESNIGVAKTLNLGLSIATGKYIFRMDADDIAYPKRLEKSIDYLEKNPEVVVLGSYAKLFGKKKGLLKLPVGNQAIRSEMVFNNPFCHPTVVFRKDFIQLNQIKYPEDASNEDYNLWVSLSKNKNVVFANIPKPLLRYRIHDAQVTASKLSKLMEDTRIIIGRMLQIYNVDKYTQEQLDSYVKTIYSKEKVTKGEFKSMLYLFEEIISRNKLSQCTDGYYLETSLRKKSQNAYANQVLRFHNKLVLSREIKMIGKKPRDIKSNIAFAIACVLVLFQHKR